MHTVQDKLNNPSPEDPFEPEVAAVRTYGFRRIQALILTRFARLSIFYLRMFWLS